MKLIKCNIINYGKLHNVSIDFNSGLNSLFEKNGWGKSTLCSFIKVMLYGFDDEGKTSILNERTHFFPWQGGSYGGSLVIETEGKRYEIKREFQAKKNTGSFSLYDETTGLPSTDYSENIGEEIFGIDMESFKRSLFISQESCKCSVTDGINAKIGNLVDNTDDINRYEIVNDNLKTLLNNNSKDRSTGNLFKLNEEIQKLKIEVDSKTEIDLEIEKIADELQEKKDKIILLEKDRDVYSLKIREVAEYKDKAAKKILYDSYVKSYLEKRADFEEINKYFSLGCPEQSEFEKIRIQASKYSSLEMKCENLKNYLNSKELINLKEDEKKYHELDEIYGKTEYDDGKTSLYMSKWGERQEKINSSKMIQLNIKNLKNLEKEKLIKTKKSKKLKELIYLIAAVLFAAFLGVTIISDNIGLKLFADNSFKIAAGFLLATAFVIFVIMFALSRKKKITETESSSIIELRDELEKNNLSIAETENTVMDYLAKYGENYNEYTVLEQLFFIRNQAAEYKKLKNRVGENIEKQEEKQKELEESMRKLKELKLEIDYFFSRYDLKQNYDSATEDDLLFKLHDIKIKAASYMECRLQYEKAMASKEEFEKNYPEYEDLNHIKIKYEEDSVELYENKIIDISNALRENDKEIKIHENKLEELKRKLEDINLKQTRLDELNEKYKEGLHRLEIVRKTKKYLTDAKLNLINKYTKPIKDSFDEYYNILTEIGSDNCHYEKLSDIDPESNNMSLDANLNLMIDKTSKKLSLSYLSKGYQDLTGFCLRMAFIEAMYKKEKPFIILDDPFSNLDDEKLKNAKKLIKEIADNYQIIYLTCNETRECN